MPATLRYRHTFVAVLSNGATATTSTRTLRYQYAVEATRTDNRVEVTGWYSSRPEAVRAANTRRVRYPDQAARVLPVTHHPYSSAAAAAARDASTRTGAR